MENTKIETEENNVSKGRQCYFVCGAPGVGKSTQQHMQLTKFGGSPANWRETQKMSDNFKGETTEVVVYSTYQRENAKETNDEEKVEFCILDCPGLSGPAGKPEEISNKVAGVCEVNNIRLNGMVFMNNFGDIRLNSVNQQMAKQAPAILEDLNTFWSQSIFIATQCNRFKPEELERKKTSFRKMIKSEELVGNKNGCRIVDKNIIFALDKLEGSGLVERLLEISKSKQSYGKPKVVESEKLINMVAEVNGIDQNDFEGMKEIRAQYEEEKKNRVKQMAEFKENLKEERKQNENNQTKIKAYHKSVRDKLNAENMRRNAEQEEKNEKLVREVKMEKEEIQKAITKMLEQQEKERAKGILKAEKAQKELEEQHKQQQIKNERLLNEEKLKRLEAEFDFKFFVGLKRLCGVTHFGFPYNNLTTAREATKEEKWAGNAVCIVQGDGTLAFSEPCTMPLFITEKWSPNKTGSFNFSSPEALMRKAYKVCCSDTNKHVREERNKLRN